jgi:antitoxin (DNA-binding transcriptional repressor) of toxin-antitoxin stability system
MVTKQLDVGAKALTVDELLALLERDTEILLMKGDIPLARLSPVEQSVLADAPRIPGLHAGTTWVSADFDDPLQVIE